MRLLDFLLGRTPAAPVVATTPVLPRAQFLADVRDAPVPTTRPTADSHTLLRVASYMGIAGELTVKDGRVVCVTCGGTCGQCGWGPEIGLPYTATLPHLKAHV